MQIMFISFQVNAWYEKAVFQRHSTFGRYVICLFKAVKTFMGTGYIKDLQPTEREYSHQLNRHQ